METEAYGIGTNQYRLTGAERRGEESVAYRCDDCGEVVVSSRAICECPVCGGELGRAPQGLQPKSG